MNINRSTDNFSYMSIYVTGHTGMLGELVGSHTKAVIHPTYTIH